MSELELYLLFVVAFFLAFLTWEYFKPHLERKGILKKEEEPNEDEWDV